MRPSGRKPTDLRSVSLEAGVSRTHIVDGRIVHAILLEIFTDTGVGTLLGR